MNVHGKQEIIDKWKARVGEEKAALISKRATDRGNIIHNIAEKYIRNEDGYLKDVDPINTDTFLSIKRHLDAHVDEIYGIELSLYSHLLQTAGRTDLAAKYDGIPSIIDFKTSEKEKKEEWIENYFIQETTYSLMMEERYGLKFPQIVTIMSIDDGISKVFVKRAADYYGAVKKIFIDLAK